jgi:hypothetical protein
MMASIRDGERSKKYEHVKSSDQIMSNEAIDLAMQAPMR